MDLNRLGYPLLTNLQADERLVLKDALERSQLALLSSVWATNWGSFETFEKWVRDGRATPLPDPRAAEARATPPAPCEDRGLSTSSAPPLASPARRDLSSSASLAMMGHFPDAPLELREKNLDFVGGLFCHRLARSETVGERLATTTLDAARRQLCLIRTKHLHRIQT